MKRKSVSLLATIPVALAASLSMSTPAQATIADCDNLPTGQYCWFQHNNYSGAWGHRTSADIWSLPNHCWSMGAWGNQTSAYVNDTFDWMVLLDGACYGSLIYAAPASARSFAANDAWNDRIGGVQPCFECTFKAGKLTTKSGKVIRLVAKDGVYVEVKPEGPQARLDLS